MASNKTLHNDSVDQLYKQGEKLPSVPASPYLKEILDCSDDVISCAMDAVGLRLRDVARQLDYQHPEIGSVLKGVFSNDLVSDRICNYLKLAEYAINQKFSQVQLYRSALTKAPAALRSIDSVEKNQQLIRLLSDCSLRNKIRGMKEVRPVEMRYLLKKGKTHWAQMPTDFSYYTRYSEAYKKDVEEAKMKIGVYEELGCKALRRTIESRIALFADHMQNTFCGFHRIKMGDAAAIAGRSIGAVVTSASSSSDVDLLVRVGCTAIKKYTYSDPKADYSILKMPRYYNYVARAYPYIALEEIASANMKRAIDHLENLPESGGKPLFDHYIVMVPSVAYPSEPNKITRNAIKYAFRAEGGLNEFDDPEECAKQLDRAMIRNGDTNPILLGERDGECYFICYWI